MHDYAFASVERRRWTIAIFCISIVLSTFLQPLVGLVSSSELDPFLKSIQLRHWSTLIFRGATPIVVFGFFHMAFSKRLWRNSLLRSSGLVSLPDLNGTWQGHLITSYKNHSKTPIKVTIRQTWDKMSVKLNTCESTSASFIAAIQCDGGEQCILYYLYKNEPNQFVRDTMHEHGGTARLHIEKDELRGDYYTGRDRYTQGEIVLNENHDTYTVKPSLADFASAQNRAAAG